MRILVTAGPTREPIDPVRFIGNRSSGKMGYALAAAARRRGHTTALISGPVSLPAPEGVDLERIGTAAEMLEAVRRRLPASDALIMAAAVADWRPAAVSPVKLKKGAAPPLLPLEATVDILKAVATQKGLRVFVGFAAETGEAVAEARRKLREKNLDLIVANDVSQPDAGFEVDTNRAVLIPAEGAPEALPLMSKADLADRIVAWIEAFTSPSRPGSSC